MGLAPQLITNELYKIAAKHLKTLSQDNRAAIRLRAIVSAYEHGVNVVAKVFGVNSNTIRSWVKAFSKEDVAGLEYQPGRGRKGKLTDLHLKEIDKWVQENPNLTITAILQKLKQVYEIESSKSAVHRALHKLKLSYITPRPIHHKQDKKLHPEFKKKSKRDRGKKFI
jgi:transposase